jgi:hypothetical protein
MQKLVFKIVLISRIFYFYSLLSSAVRLKIVCMQLIHNKISAKSYALALPAGIDSGIKTSYLTMHAYIVPGVAMIRATQHITNASYNQRQRFFHSSPDPWML